MSDEWFSKYPGLEFERKDHGILLMTINRPDHMNATDAPATAFANPPSPPSADSPSNLPAVPPALRNVWPPEPRSSASRSADFGTDGRSVCGTNAGGVAHDRG